MDYILGLSVFVAIGMIVGGIIGLIESL